MQKLITRSVEETIDSAKRFAKSLKAGDALALVGDLGSGKTTFVKGLALGLGLKSADEVTSPTFTIMNIYRTKPPLYHYDLYRMETAKEIAAIGFEEFANDPHAIICIEWAERAKTLFPPGTRKIRFRVLSDESRRIEFSQ
jgi:tRNA threonylcarbamoyladenosine biosynthesis protein TsaE